MEVAAAERKQALEEMDREAAAQKAKNNAEYEAAHRRLAARAQEHKAQSEAATRMQRAARGLLTRRAVAAKIAKRVEDAAAEQQTRALMAEALRRAEMDEAELVHQTKAERRRRRLEAGTSLLTEPRGSKQTFERSVWIIRRARGIGCAGAAGGRGCKEGGCIGTKTRAERGAGGGGGRGAARAGGRG